MDPTFQPSGDGASSATWFEATSVDELEAFYRSRLSAIREAARKHGYAIGVHGSLRRDFDLIAMAWQDNASDRNTLARAIAFAACGMTRGVNYDWERKPNHRYATSIPVCWTTWHGEAGLGHIDLSLIDTSEVDERLSKETIAKMADRSRTLSERCQKMNGVFDIRTDTLIPVSRVAKLTNLSTKRVHQLYDPESAYYDPLFPIPYLLWRRTKFSEAAVLRWIHSTQ